VQRGVGATLGRRLSDIRSQSRSYSLFGLLGVDMNTVYFAVNKRCWWFCEISPRGPHASQVLNWYLISSLKGVVSSGHPMSPFLPPPMAAQPMTVKIPVDRKYVVVPTSACKVRFFFSLVSYCDVRVQSKSLVLKETSLY
jgi:hypothetical protein